MKVWTRAFLVFLVIIYQNLYAVEVERLYETEVIAKSEQEVDRNVAIKQAMQRVLLRILAGNNVLQDETVNGVLTNATQYVSEYQYSLAETGYQESRLMRVLFNEELLVSTLRAGKIGLWNEIRPRTLVWLVVEDHGVKQFFDADEMPRIEWALNKAAKQKKIPVMFPIQDLSEKRTLSIADVLSVYSEHLLEVSVRYEVVSTLAGKIVKQGDCWKAEWTLYFDAKIDQWRGSCSSIDKATLSGFQGVYNRLSAYYAAKPEAKLKQLSLNQNNSIKMKVSGIKRSSEITQVREYLESLSMIKIVRWVAAKGSNNIYRIFYQGSREDLHDMLVAGRILREEVYSKHNVDEVQYQFLSN